MTLRRLASSNRGTRSSSRRRETLALDLPWRLQSGDTAALSSCLRRCLLRRWPHCEPLEPRSSELQRRLRGTLQSRTSLLPNDSLRRFPTRSSSISIAIRETRSLITTSLPRRSSHNVVERLTWWSWELVLAAPSQGLERLTWWSWELVLAAPS